MKTQLLAVGLAFLFAPAAMAQTADELAKGSTNTSNVVNYGMGYDLNRFSPLKTINKDNVKHLVPVWNYSYD
ncbi:MAG TPA: PQQ-dependent dehydrogenase, methanol/ethanol family, partial [Casimicrobiaceae bacterium]